MYKETDEFNVYSFDLQKNKMSLTFIALIYIVPHGLWTVRFCVEWFTTSFATRALPSPLRGALCKKFSMAGW